MDITLDDVESAIVVLRAFLQKSREVASVMRQLESREGGSYGRGGSFGMPSAQEIFRLVMDDRARKQSAEGKTPDQAVEMSQDDLDRMKAITEKRKGNQGKP